VKESVLIERNDGQELEQIDDRLAGTPGAQLAPEEI